MNKKVNIVGSAKTKNNQKRRPRIRLAGFWLNEIGFEANSLATLKYDHGSIEIKLQGSGIDTYNRLIKSILANKTGLLQVKEAINNKKSTPHIEVTGFWLEQLGFQIGSVLLVQYAYGLINIRLIDLDKLATRGLL